MFRKSVGVESKHNALSDYGCQKAFGDLVKG